MSTTKSTKSGSKKSATKKPAVRKVGPVSAETGVTKYGSRSKPGAGHFFRWASGKAGDGTGKCIHCAARLKFVPKGERGGKMRVYSKDGKTFSEKEFACKRASANASEKKAA